MHDTGLPWNDASGQRLRQWLAMDEVQFYDTRQVAIAATGLCYPGTVDGADLPPRPECAPRWQARIRAALPELRLVLLVGAHAQAFHLGERRMSTLAQTVHAWERYLPEYFPLPHPSWRTTAWLARRPWFAEALLPALRERVRAALA